VQVGDYLNEFGQPKNITMSISDYVEYMEGGSDFRWPDPVVEGAGPYAANQQIPEALGGGPTRPWRGAGKFVHGW
jgi:hypothetical protein